MHVDINVEWNSCECVAIVLPEPNKKGQPVQDVHSSGETWPPYIPFNSSFSAQQAYIGQVIMHRNLTLN